MDQNTAADPGFTWEHVLYRFYDREDTLLYIGITNSIRGRFKAHAAERPWWPEVADCQTEFLPSRTALEEAEVVAIKTENPRYNVQHNRLQPTDLRPDGFTHDEWAWMHQLGKYRSRRRNHLEGVS